MSVPPKMWPLLAARCGLVLLLFAIAPQFTASAMNADEVSDLRDAAQLGRTVVAGNLAPGIGGYVHRLANRTERSLGRAANLFVQIGSLWLWVIASALLFFAVSALSSVADVRMFDLRRGGVQRLSADLRRGTRMFFRILRDRRTPYLARSVIVVAFLYWLAPVDLIPDSPIMPGFIDDLVITVSAAKGFMYLCPDALVESLASAMQAEEHSQRGTGGFASPVG